MSSDKSIAVTFSDAFLVPFNSEAFHSFFRYVRMSLSELTEELEAATLDEDLRSTYRATLKSLEVFFSPTNYDQRFTGYRESHANTLHTQTLLLLHDVVVRTKGYHEITSEELKDFKAKFDGAKAEISASEIDDGLKRFLVQQVDELSKAVTLSELLGVCVLRDVWSVVFGACSFQYLANPSPHTISEQAKKAFGVVLMCLTAVAGAAKYAGELGQSIEWLGQRLQITTELRPSGAPSNIGSAIPLKIEFQQTKNEPEGDTPAASTLQPNETDSDQAPPSVNGAP